MRFRLFIASVMMLAVLGEPLYAAMTPAQKRAKAKEVQMRKREAAKRKAKKQKEIQRRKSRKQRIKDGKPLTYIYTYDLRTGNPLPATHVQLQAVGARPNKRPLINKPTDAKRARVSKGVPFGPYWAYASEIGGTVSYSSEMSGYDIIQYVKVKR